MGRKRDWTGVVQGDLRVIEEAGVDTHGNILWRCECSCGTTSIKPNSALKAGVKSCSAACGVSASNRRRVIHGLHKSKEYYTWAGVKQRCTNPKSTAYKYYGARGVGISALWVHDFEQFLADVGRAPSPEASLDRIDNDGDYEPGNVRWASVAVQALNRRDNVLVERDGVTKTLSEWDALMPGTHIVSQRYAKGKRGEALFAPVTVYSKQHELDGVHKTLREWERELGICYQTLHWRASHNRNLKTGGRYDTR